MLAFAEECPAKAIAETAKIALKCEELIFIVSFPLYW
jgi:hypothetical protein